MKLSCKVIEDMLPMYYDKVCSEDSAALIEEHLKSCPHCSQMLSDLRAGIDIHEQKVDDIKPLKKIQKSYKKMKLGWLIAIICVVILTPIAFIVGAQQGEQKEQVVDYSKEEATACANEFMTYLVNADYAKAYAYWDVAGEKKDLLTDNRFTEEILMNFDADGLKKFCEGGEKLETMGGLESFEFVEISEPNYANSYGTEDYTVSYKISFDGKDEMFCVSVTKYGINHISSGNGLIRHPLSHLTLWVQWVVDDYQGRYYDFDSGQWVENNKSDNQ